LLSPPGGLFPSPWSARANQGTIWATLLGVMAAGHLASESMCITFGVAMTVLGMVLKQINEVDISDIGTSRIIECLYMT